MKDKSRIVGRKVEIDKESTKEFFEKRTKRDLAHSYNYVIYQDSHPELALERDKYEKQKMVKYLKFGSDDHVLDIGCGVGRWGDEIIRYIENGRYIGIDFSNDLLQIAKDNLFASGKCEFYQGPFQEIESILVKNGVEFRFDKILINGVLMYINDNEINGCLKSVDNLLNGGGQGIY